MVWMVETARESFMNEIMNSFPTVNTLIIDVYQLK
jgi:hypothetical protein